MLAPALRKAAVLISALDRDSADALLEQMPEDQAAQVRLAIMELPEVGRDEQDKVLREFFSGRNPSTGPQSADATFPTSDDGGVELQLGASFARTDVVSQISNHNEAVSATSGIPSRATIPAKNADPDDRASDAQITGATDARASETQGDARPMFEYLQKATAETLSQLLLTEHPQVTAVVISRLAPEKAAKIIETFDPQLQVDVLHRVAAIGEADPDSMRRLDLELSAILRKLDPALQLNDSGVQAVSAILNATSQRQQILQRLHVQNSPLSPRVSGADFRPSEIGSADDLAARAIGAEPERLAATGDLPSRMPVSQNPVSLTSSAPVSSAPVSSAPTSLPPTSFTPTPNAPSAPLGTLDFVDVTQLPDADLAILLRSASPQVVLLSLLGAEPAFVNRLMRQLPPADARRFRERFRQTTPLSLADIDEAQRRLALLAAELIAAGRIQKTRAQFAAAA